MKTLTRVLAAVLTICLIAPAAAASPVAQTKAERDLYGRVFLEPNTSYNYIQFGDGKTGEFEGGMRLLQKLYPRYLRFTSVDKELHDPNAVSVGADGYPAWDERDTGDGLPFHAAIVTDRTVPDSKKQYVALMSSHQAEPCGREAMWRTVEDLLIWATEDKSHLLDDATGKTGKTHELTAGEILKRVKIYVVSVNPDGWHIGDGPLARFSQYNGAGINSNRVAYQDGWSFPPDPVLFQHGYTTLTQPESSAALWLRQVREEELHGRGFAVGMDVHGPLPAGFILLHDQGNTPEKLERVQDFGLRIRQNMEGTEPPSEAVDAALDDLSERVRQMLPDNRDLGTQDQNAWRQAGWGRWGFVTHINDSLDYTAANTWGGWMNSHTGLDADSLSYEINCRQGPWDPVTMQKFVDNVRAVYQTGIVAAAIRDHAKPFHVKVKGNLGFYEDGERITDKDGNPVPPPRGFPGTPLLHQIKQGHYDVENTDYFRDLPELIQKRLQEVREPELDGALEGLDTFVVSDKNVHNTDALKSFVESGGNLILTDSSLKLLPKVSKIPANKIGRGWAYTGYADLDRSQPLTHDLLQTARQTFDPTGLGYPLLMERDGYWGNNQTQEGSPTMNSSANWWVDRDTWEGAGGVTIGTVDPPKDRKGTTEGPNQDKTAIGTLEVGKGRVVIFGALLPQPTENYPHWFGLDAYTISAAGQTMLLRAMSWGR